MEAFIIDACSLIAFFKNEAGADKVYRLFERAVNEDLIVHLHAINLYEVFYDFYRSDGKQSADKILSLIEDLPVLRNDLLDNNLFNLSAYYKSNFRVSLADSILLGISEQLDATVVAADHHEFDVIEKETDLKFFWIR